MIINQETNQENSNHYSVFANGEVWNNKIMFIGGDVTEVGGWVGGGGGGALIIQSLQQASSGIKTFPIH